MDKKKRKHVSQKQAHAAFSAESKTREHKPKKSAVTKRVRGNG